MKMFKAKKINKRKSKSKLKVLLFTFFFFFSYVFAFFHSKEYKYDKNILYDNINYIDFKLYDFVFNEIEEKINKPINLLNNNVKEISTKMETEDTKKVNMVNVEKEEVYNPLIYIYNTHESEKYIDFSINDASLYLADKLNKQGIDTYFEEQSVTAFLQSNDLKYYKSYAVSRKYLEEAKEKYQSINYYFDIHRDALSKNKSTAIINGKEYAKILFVVGKENMNYEQNLNNVNRLNNIINAKAPSLSRGVMTKEGSGVDGIYNQDLSNNVFLIEIGGNNNTKDEVLRTVDMLANCIYEYINGVL